MGVLDTLAQTLADTIDDMSVTFTDGNNASHTTAVKGYKWAPRDLDGAGPWGVIELPTVTRIGLDEAETQVGTKDWAVEFPVVFYIPLDEAAYAQALATAVVEDWLTAIDDNPFTADATVDDITVTDAGPAEIDADSSRPVVIYPTTVQLMKFVA